MRTDRYLCIDRRHKIVIDLTLNDVWVMSLIVIIISSDSEKINMRYSKIYTLC